MTTPKHTVENCETLAATIATTMSKAELRDFVSEVISERLIKDRRSFAQNLPVYWDYIPDGEEQTND